MDTPQFSRTLKRNCSMSPADLAKVFAALAALVLAIGAGFAAAGAWLVLPFAGLEVLLLGAAFVLHARHAADYERIELQSGRLEVEVTEADRVARYQLQNARVSMEEGRVVLRDAKEEIEIGRHIGAEARAELVAELEKTLIQGRIA
ncbi:MAG TPA: DUF2244 domain-containing protein [Burkholderiales bacterium]|nr:DUF2244 domain-containing protein [Burkholderiales bacterium]